MNAECLHAICIEINDALKSTGIFNLLSSVTTALSGTISQPQQSAAHQQQLTNHLTKLNKELQDFPTDKFSPGWQEILKELGGSEILGKNLAYRINSILERNQITPASALQEIQKIQQDIKLFQEAVDSATKAFHDLHIGSEELEPGECELSILIPRIAVQNNIKKFGKELEDISFIFSTFSEITTGERDTFQIKTISSTDLMVILAAIPPVAACIAHVVEKLINIYKSLLEIKKLKGDLEEQGLSKTNLKGITSHAESLMSNGIEDLTNEIILEYSDGSDESRTNELSNAVRISLNKLANRIDQGFNIEVRARALEEPTDGDNEVEEQQMVQEQLQSIIDSAAKLKFLKPQGARILHLPEKQEKSKETK